MNYTIKLIAAASVTALLQACGGGGNGATGGGPAAQATDFVLLTNTVLDAPETANPSALNDQEFVRLDEQDAFDSAF